MLRFCRLGLHKPYRQKHGHAPKPPLSGSVYSGYRRMLHAGRLSAGCCWAPRGQARPSTRVHSSAWNTSVVGRKPGAPNPPYSRRVCSAQAFAQLGHTASPPRAESTFDVSDSLPDIGCCCCSFAVWLDVIDEHPEVGLRPRPSAGSKQ